MADHTKIEWTEATWNPLVGCTKVSPGCDNCYAETLVNRFAGTSSAFPTRFDTVNLRGERMLTQPLRWAKPRRIFVNSLSDLFHADVPESFIARVFAVMALAPEHTFQLLTKRHGRMRGALSDERFIDAVWWQAGKLALVRNAQGLLAPRPRLDSRNVGTWPLPNVWLGVSAEDQHWASIRIPALLDTPSAVRWVSAEPLLGPLDLGVWLHPAPDMGPVLDWVVAGGESGPNARPMNPDWARQIRDECRDAGTPFLFKQWGSHDANGRRVAKQTAGRELDGRAYDGYPA